MILARISPKPESSRFIFLELAIYIVLRKYKKLNSLICSEFNLLSHLFSLFSHFCNAHLLFVSRLSTFPSCDHSSVFIDCLCVDSKLNNYVWGLRTLLPIACGVSKSKSRVHTRLMNQAESRSK